MEIAFATPLERRDCYVSHLFESTVAAQKRHMRYASSFAVNGVYTYVRDKKLTTAGLWGSRAARLITQLGAGNQVSPRGGTLAAVRNHSRARLPHFRAVSGLLNELDFADPGLFAKLETLSADPAQFDDLAFGLVGMDIDGTVVAYNRFESESAGLSAERCIGLNFFNDIAPCTNNYLVSGRKSRESL